MSEDFRRTGSDPPSDTTPVGPAPSPGRAGAQDGAVPPEGPGPVHSDEPAASWREEGPGDFSNATAPPPPGADPAGATRRQRDPNVDAIARAGLAAGTDAWLREVASQVDPRLDRCAPGWRTAEQAGAARACVFGLMLGRLANDYPHTSGDLGRVAESHPSFATLTAGSRLATLREIADDRHRGATWIAPLVGLDDPAPLRDILD